MNEEIQAKVLEELGNVAEMTKVGIAKTVEVMQEQCPLLVEELLRWKFTESLIWFCVLVLPFVLLGVHLVNKFRPKKIQATIKTIEDDGLGCVFIFVPIVGGGLWLLFGPLVVMGHDFLAWIQISIAPRLFLLEYVSDLIN